MLLYGDSPAPEEPTLDERHERVPATSALPRTVRAAIDDTFEQWGFRHLSNPACLCATELVSGLDRSCGDVELVLARRPKHVLVELRCAGPTPRFHEALKGATARARSIAVVDAIVPIWGVRPLPAGDAVWFELPTNGEAAP